MPTSTLPLPLPAAPPSPASPSPSTEQLIGELVATAACLFAQGLSASVRAGRVVPMSAEFKQQGGSIMAALIELREHTAGIPAFAGTSFDHMAQVHGTRVLREWWGSNVSAAVTDDLVAAVLDILADIIRLRLH